MLAPVSDRPPAGVPGVTLALLNLIGRDFKEAAQLALEYGYQPIRTPPAGGPQDRRPFYGLYDARLCLDFEGRVEEVLVPRPLTPEESQAAGDNFRLLQLLIRKLVYAQRKEPTWEDIVVQLMTDLYVTSFLSYCPTKAKITTFVYHRMYHNLRRMVRPAVRRMYVERYAARPVSLTIYRELESIPQAEPPPALIPDPARAAALVRDLSPGISDRNLDVIVRRLGLCGPPETLAVIAAAHGVTRERVRQIVARFEGDARRVPNRVASLQASL